VNSFAGVSPLVYERFLNNCIRQINVQGINHLVLDIRKNGGGREGFDNVLLSHFNHTLEQKYDRIVAKTMSYSEYGQLERPKYSQFKDWMYRVFEFKPTEEGWTRKYDRFERKLKPSKYTFDGDVYVLISGQVFSAGSDFAAMAKEYIPNCLLIGSETLGGNQGNASGYYYRVVLPNTGFVLEVPRVLFELNINNPNKHGGVEPDIHVVTSIEDFLQGVDPHMSVVRDIVQEKLCLATDFTQ
jgi:C-terminal processing protease CtpA/Prc